MYNNRILGIIKLVIIGILVFVGITYLVNSNFTRELDPVATKAYLVYNIKRDSLEYKWRGGTLVLNLNGRETNLYLNPEVVKADENIFADSENLVIRDSCRIVQLKIDLELAKINNDLTSIHFDEELKPKDIVTELRCI